MHLTPEVECSIRTSWDSAEYGAKSAVISKWASILKCSESAIYDKLQLKRKRKKGDRIIENIEDIAHKVAMVKKKPPERVGEISTAQAIEIAIGAGLIPKAMHGKKSTINRVIREMGLTKRTRRVQRYQAARPNEMHQVDASSSKYFYIHRKTEDGKDYKLRLHVGQKGYKNKPVPIRLRPWAYGLTDDHSGVIRSRYVAAMGENAEDNMEFLLWAWSQEIEHTMFGKPDFLKGDLGPMMRSPAFKAFLKGIGTEIDPSDPENPRAHGKIERIWRSCFESFERTFFACPDWKKFEITLSELNRQFLNFQQTYNDMPHRNEKEISRYQAWQRISLYGGAIAIPENALQTIARRRDRYVDTAGCFSLDNIIYEVKGLHDANVFVYEGLFEDKLVVEDKKTGDRYEVKRFAPNPRGKYKAPKESPHEKVVKQAQSLDITSHLFESPKDKGNVTIMPTRIRETQAIDNPLSTGVYSSIDEAMREFSILFGARIEGENREAIKQRILSYGLSRHKVTDLAYTLRATIEGRAVNG